MPNVWVDLAARISLSRKSKNSPSPDVFAGEGLFFVSSKWIAYSKAPILSGDDQQDNGQRIEKSLA